MKMVYVIAITGVIYSAAYARMIMILKDVQDSFSKGDTTLVAKVSLVAVGLALIVSISRYFHIYLMNYVSELVVNGLRLKLQQKFMRLNLTFHSNYSAGSGGLISRILNDIKTIQDGLRMVADFFREPLLAILLLGNLFYLNWKLTATLLILVPFVLHFLRVISKSLRKYVLNGQENLEKMTSTIKESLDGVRIIQSFNLENVLGNKLKSEANDYVEIRRRVHARVEIMSPVVEFIASALILGIFFYFSKEVASGQITTGAVLAYIASMMAINQPIKKLQESYVRIQETVVSSARVFALLDEPSEVPLSEKNLPFPKDWKKITYKDVSFAYHNQLILKNINFEISRGEHIAFVGESGSGKSTIVNLLERFYDPAQGQILIDGIDIRDIDLKDLRRNVALVSQDVFLFSDSIERNIQAGNFDRSLSDVEAVAKSAHAHDFIIHTGKGYKGMVGDRGSLLSGGEKQRISIARAFFKDAPILILDEATSALDSASEGEVQKGLDSLMAGRTALVIAHRLSTVQDADRIYVMKKGQIIETGTHNELLGLHGEYHRFYQLQNSGASAQI
jgi:ATP-binding cassette subfamily B protein/subfamily B ATP-binding cassette protein MsbA